eukprot:5268724-Pleurochrysis_carterae.AAC.1
MAANACAKATKELNRAYTQLLLVRQNTSRPGRDVLSCAIASTHSPSASLKSLAQISRQSRRGAESGDTQSALQSAAAFVPPSAQPPTSRCRTLRATRMAAPMLSGV